MSQNTTVEEPCYPIIKCRSTEKIRTSIVEHARGRITSEEKKVVTLWERHEAHPDGEVFIVAEGPACMVARTPRVQELIIAGRLVEVE